MKKKNKALFLDRDGVINKNYGYVFSMKKVQNWKACDVLVRMTEI